MSKRIEDYALIGDRRSAALVARDGSIDWLCWPSFDSDACFAALLGDVGNGHWRLAPLDAPKRTTRSYRGDTLILETRHETAGGVVRVTDLMPIGTRHRAVIRQFTSEAGEVAMAFDLALRFDYGSIPPWLRAKPRVVHGVVGPDLVVLRSPIDLERGEDHMRGEFVARPGETLSFTLQYGVSHKPEPEPIDPARAVAETETYWRDWIGGFRVSTDWPDPVKRSLLTLQALTDAETGGIIAAPTTSLPEVPGGDCNWDYRYTWLRDSTFALTAFLNAGYREEALGWRDWLLRAAAGVPERLRTMYRSDGARRTLPHDVPWLSGWEGSTPVHIGNPAADQFQLDIYGEVLNSLRLLQQAGLSGRPWDIAVETDLAAHIEKVWEKPDQGIWESRGPPLHYTHSKVMAWVGIDRYLKLKDIVAPRRRAFEALRERMHRTICRDGFDPARNSFVQTFDGARTLDASLLMLPLVGFLPIDDSRIAGTIASVERELVEDGLVRRWSRRDGPPEGAFIACTCWLADCLGMQGRRDDARAYLERVIGLVNDVGPLAEEWDARGRRFLGNFPQALSHLALINTALGLCGPVLQRGGNSLVPLHLEWSAIVLRLALSVLASAAIGVNRGEEDRPVGLRTTMLVTLAAAIAMIQVNLLLPVTGKAQDSFVVMDVMRLPLGILSGMGFIGAGAILRRNNLVQGVTTAATLWFATVMGLCFGGGQLALGLAALALGVFVLWPLKWAEHRAGQHRRGILSITTDAAAHPEQAILPRIAAAGFRIGECAISLGGNTCTMRCDIRWREGRLLHSPFDLARELGRQPGVAAVEWRPLERQ